MELEDRINLTKVYRATDKTIDFVNDLFMQGDMRYTGVYDDIVVAGFIDNNGIIVEEKVAPSGLENVKLNENDLKLVREPQKDDKILTIQLLKNLRFEVIGTEISFCGGKVDVLGRSRGKTIAIECRSCRINKAIDYLEQENTELWLIPVDFWQTKKFFVVSRGPNWNNYFKFHQNYNIKQLRSIKNLWIKYENDTISARG